MLELRDVTAGYGSTTVLRSVNLIVPAGTTVALLGPNAAGKTTTLRLASGLIRPTSGQLLIDGKPVHARGPEELAALGVCHVPEGRGIFPSLTVRDNLRLWCRDGDNKRATALAAEAFPRLGERLDQTAGTLSGGEQQMLALSRAYIQQPRLVLLDEVSMGLAPVFVDEIFTFLGRLAASGAALLLVEQYVTKALAIADLVSVLAKGAIVFAGEPSEVDSADILRQYLEA